MAGVSHQPGDIAGHPDVSEMRERYARMMGTRGVVAVDGLVFLAGLYAAISAWTVHFAALSPQLAINNLIMGLAVAVLGLTLTMSPDRMHGMSGAIAAIGIWLIVSPWVVVAGHSPSGGMILSNVICGAVILLCGLTAGGMLMRNAKKT